MNVTEFADRLTARGVDVVLGRHVDGHARISVGEVDEVTGNEHAYLDGAKAGIYVRRSGQVWVLGGGDAVKVNVALVDAKGTTTEAQDVAVGVMLGIDKPLVISSSTVTSSGGASTVTNAKPRKAPAKKAAARKATAKS